ncbi:MAG: hypothetical protein HFH23_09455 [Ruminococcus sp.]|nr:hypothetical protein [Ruminococcus sp.]
MKKIAGITASGFLVLCFIGFLASPSLESATLSADTSIVYDVDEQIEIDVVTEPDNYSFSTSSFHVSGGEIEEIDGTYFFSSDEPGTFDVRLGSSEEKCNTLTFSIEDKAAVAKAEKEAGEKKAKEEKAKKKADEEAAKKKAEEEAAKKKAEEERIAAEKAEEERLAAEKAEQERIAAEQAEQARIAAELAEQQRIAAEQAEQQRIATEQAEQARIAAEQAAQQQQQEQLVWISATGKKYHSRSNCGNMDPNKAYQLTLSEAQARGYDACKRCH